MLGVTRRPNPGLGLGLGESVASLPRFVPVGRLLTCDRAPPLDKGVNQPDHAEQKKQGQTADLEQCRKFRQSHADSPIQVPAVNQTSGVERVRLTSSHGQTPMRSQVSLTGASCSMRFLGGTVRTVDLRVVPVRPIRIRHRNRPGVAMAHVAQP